MKYYIGKVLHDTFGHKKDEPEYLLMTLSKTKKDADRVTALLAGFAGYEVVQVALCEVKEFTPQIKPLRKNAESLQGFYYQAGNTIHVSLGSKKVKKGKKK